MEEEQKRFLEIIDKLLERINDINKNLKEVN